MNGKIIFGSMRITDYNYDDEHWVDLFCKMYHCGIDTHHVSSEYDSYLRYLRIFKLFKKTYPEMVIKFIVKLAEPHFGFEFFDVKRFDEKIFHYKKDLSVDQIDTVQWMWRGNLKQDNVRIANYSNFSYKIKKAVEEKKSLNLIKNFFLFPYSKGFAKRCASDSYIDGLIVYRNPMENDYDSVIDLYANKNKSCLTIRPFNCGKALKKFKPEKLIEYAFNKCSIEGTIISFSNVQQLSFLN